METKTKIEVGDRITFRAVTRHSDKSVSRLVNGFVTKDGTGWIGSDERWPTVRFEGWDKFIVRPWEITDVEGAA